MSLKTLNPCHECEETEFVGKHGVFFCTTCGTKYQGEHDMELEMDNTNRNMRFTKLQSAKKQKLAHDLRKPDQSAKSSQKCNKYELFQLLLKHQVEALIKLGAHPRLKDVVFEMWMKYLAVTKIAFYDKEDRTVKTHLENTPAKEGKTKKKRESSIKLSLKIQEEDTKLEHDEIIEEHKDAGLDDDQTVADDTDKHLPSRPRMKLPYTLALCYLGLIYTNPLTTFMDLIRWVKDFKIPFCNAGDYLPKDVAVPFRKTFTAYTDPSTINISTIRYLQRDVKVMALYLNLEDSPPVPLRMFVQKYTTLLNLPDDIHSLSCKLVGSTRVTVLSLKREPALLTNLEITATSYIVVILKLLFGFNGHTEKEFSFCSRKLMANLKNRHRLFDLEEWVRFMKEQMIMGARQETVMDQLTSGSEIYNDTETNSKSQSVYIPLVTLSRIWDRRKKEIESTGSDVIDNFSSENSTKQNYFRHSSLQHILHPESFLKSLDQFKLASLHDVLIDREIQDRSEDGLQTGTNTSESLLTSEQVVENLQTSSSNVDCMQNNLSKSMNSSGTRMDYTAHNRSLGNQSERGSEGLAKNTTETAQSDRIETNDVTQLQLFLKTNFRTTIVKNEEQFDDVIQQIIFTRNSLHSNYVVCPKQTTSIYDEVLNICSHLIFTHPNMLHRQVQETEKSIFNDMKTDLTNFKSSNKMQKK